MRNWLVILPVAWGMLGIIAFACDAEVQKPEISKEAVTVLNNYLARDCAVGVHELKDLKRKTERMGEKEEKQTVTALQVVMELNEKEKNLQRVLRRITERGLSEQDVKRVERSLKEQWAQREAFLKTNPRLGLKKEDLDIAKRLTEETYVKQGLEQFKSKYQGNSAIALVAIGSQENLEFLRKVSGGGDEKLRKVIGAALAVYKSGGENLPALRE